MTREQLQACTKKVLADMARTRGIDGWHAMRKEELVEALAAPTRRPRSKTAQPQPQTAAARNTSATSSTEEQVERSKYEVGVSTKDLSAKVPKDLPAGYGKDRIVVMVRDPYWLHAYWELTRLAVQRAEAALGQDWHGAKPILRLLDVSSQDTTSAAKRLSAISKFTAAAIIGISMCKIRRAPSAWTSAISPNAAASMSWPVPMWSAPPAPASVM